MRRLLFQALFQRAILIILVVGGLLGAYHSVSAHANLIRSIPANNDVLSVPPKQVIIWFSEAPQVGFSEIDVFDQTTKQIDLKNSTIAPQDIHQMTVGLPDNLPNGTYTVRWSAVSAVDGHHTTGAFVFAVGEQLSAAAISTAAMDGMSDMGSGANPVDAILKWLDIVALSLLTGSLLISVIVIRPILPSMNFPVRLISRVVAVAISLSLIGALAELIVKMAGLYGLTSSTWLSVAGIGNWVTLLTTTRYGLLLSVRLFLTLLVIVWWSVWRRGMPSRRLWVSGIGLSLGLLLTLSLTSHGAASLLWPTISLAIDWLHLSASSAWIGGLLTLVLALRLMTNDQRRNALARFSTVATFSLGILALTGLYSAGVQIYTIDELWQTDYGRWLLLKLALIGVLLLLGLVNHLALNPKHIPAALRHYVTVRLDVAQIQRRVLIESVLGLIILLVVGFMVSSQTPVPPQLMVDRTLTQTRTEGTLTVALHISPNTAGQNTYSVQVKQDNTPLTTADRLQVRFVLPTMDMQTPWVLLKPDATGHYTATGRELSVLGDWQIQLDVRPDANSNDIRLVFPWTVSPAQVGTDPSLPRPINTLMLGVLSTAVVLIGWPRVLRILRGKYGKAPEYAVIALIALLIAGSLLALLGSAYTQTVRGQGLPTVNTIPADTASIIKGQALYQQMCQHCHGAQGLGDGPDAPLQAVSPANLRIHIPLHSDADLYQIITRGWGAMPAIGAGLTPDEHWNLINYLRTLEADVSG